MEIMHTVKRKVGGKRVIVNVHVAPMDNVSFHSKTSVQKWKYVFQRRIIIERERYMGKEALECKKIIKLVKVVGLMRIVPDSGPCYEKLVNEFIMNISIECNVEGRK